jgi:hypothetical protein
MATISDVFDQAAHAEGTTSLTLVSNQGDAIASYMVGDMRFADAPKEIVRDESPVLQRSHLESSADATVLFSDRIMTLPGPDPAGFGPQQPFDVEAPNTATIALAPTGSEDSHSATWDVKLTLPAPFNRTFDFVAQVNGSTLVGTTPAIGMSENVDEATHVMSMRFRPAPR